MGSRPEMFIAALVSRLAAGADGMSRENEIVAMTRAL
jgi:hypothetical protein